MALQAGKNGEMLIVLKVRDDGTAVIEKFGDASEREGEKASTSWNKIGKAAGAAAAAVAAAVAVMVKNAIDTADATGKAADKVGMTTEAFSALAYAAKTTADITRDNFGQAMRMMVDNLSQAAQGTGLAKNAIADLGLNAKKLAEMGPEKAVLAISDALEKIPNQGDRVRIAMDIFRNADMVNALKGGSAALREMVEQAQRTGQVISDDFARQADDFNDNIGLIKDSATGLANSLAQTVLPALNAMLQRFNVATGALDSLSVDLLKKDREFLQNELNNLNNAANRGMIISEKRVSALNEQIAALDVQIYKAEKEAPAGGGNKPGANGGGASGRAGAQEVEELAKRMIEIHSMTLGEQEKLAEDYVKGWLDLERARAAGAIQSDEELVQRRTELSDWYQQKATEAQYREQAENLAGIAAGIAAMEEEFATKEELENERYNQQLLALENYRLSEIYIEETYNANKESAERSHQERLSQIQNDALRKRFGNEHAWMEQTVDLMKGDWAFKLQGIALVLSKASQLMQSDRKKEFEFGKKAAIGEALISTFLGAAKAIGQYGFPLGAIFAALTIAVGMMNVRRIQSQQFGGGGGGGAAVPTYSANPSTGLPTGTPGGDADLPSSQLPPSPTSAAATTPRTVNVSFVGLSGPIDTEWLRDKMIPALNEAIGAGVTLTMRT